jgi:hypothetical protein
LVFSCVEVENRAASAGVHRSTACVIGPETTVNTIFSNALAIAAISVATMEPSFAQDSTKTDAPVSVLACKAVTNYASVSEGEQGQSSIPTGATVQIAFVNRSSQTATNVTFLVGDQPITYQGQFHSGVTIQHTFGPYGTVNGDATCDLSSVTFDDGRMWQRP